MTKVNIPAFYRQDEIKAQIAKDKAESQMRKYLIDLNDKNIPAVYRKQVKQAIENDSEVRAYVLGCKLDAMERENARLQTEIAVLKKELGR